MVAWPRRRAHLQKDGDLPQFLAAVAEKGVAHLIDLEDKVWVQYFPSSNLKKYFSEALKEIPTPFVLGTSGVVASHFSCLVEKQGLKCSFDLGNTLKNAILFIYKFGAKNSKKKHQGKLLIKPSLRKSRENLWFFFKKNFFLEEK